MEGQHGTQEQIVTSPRDPLATPVTSAPTMPAPPATNDPVALARYDMAVKKANDEAAARARDDKGRFAPTNAGTGDMATMPDTAPQPAVTPEPTPAEKKLAEVEAKLAELENRTRPLLPHEVENQRFLAAQKAQQTDIIQRTEKATEAFMAMTDDDLADVGTIRPIIQTLTGQVLAMAEEIKALRARADTPADMAEKVKPINEFISKNPQYDKTIRAFPTMEEALEFVNFKTGKAAPQVTTPETSPEALAAIERMRANQGKPGSIDQALALGGSPRVNATPDYLNMPQEAWDAKIASVLHSRRQ